MKRTTERRPRWWAVWPGGGGSSRTGLAGSLFVCLTILILAGCVTRPAIAGRNATPEPASGTASAAGPDPATKAALLQIAQTFNDNYDNGNFGAVWDRWDARSRALISRADYIRRHRECAPATGAAAKVESAIQVQNGAWHVRYEIERTQLVDTWYYRHHRWVFDIIQSNPRAAKEYAMPFTKYAAAVGCKAH